jgi:hypothetical protein
MGSYLYHSSISGVGEPHALTARPNPSDRSTQWQVMSDGVPTPAMPVLRASASDRLLDRLDACYAAMPPTPPKLSPAPERLLGTISQEHFHHLNHVDYWNASLDEQVPPAVPESLPSNCSDFPALVMFSHRDSVVTALARRLALSFHCAGSLYPTLTTFLEAMRRELDQLVGSERQLQREQPSSRPDQPQPVPPGPDTAATSLPWHCTRADQASMTRYLLARRQDVAAKTVEMDARLYPDRTRRRLLAQVESVVADPAAADAFLAALERERRRRAARPRWTRPACTCWSACGGGRPGVPPPPPPPPAAAAAARAARSASRPPGRRDETRVGRGRDG